MLDGVDDRLTHRNADPMQLVLVEAGRLADMIGHDLHEVEHVERAVELNTDRVRWNHLLVTLTDRTGRGMCWLSTIALQMWSSCYSGTLCELPTASPSPPRSPSPVCCASREINRSRIATPC